MTREFSEDALTKRIIDAVIRVHQALGPGFVESIYQQALLIEFRRQEMAVETEKPIDVFYESELVGRHRLDLVVEHRVILELKTVDELSKAHYAQLRSYLKATNLHIGLLINFSKDKADFRRVERP